ncbi:MAG: CvpA family protein [Flavobacteriales bacterium]|nr:CvpA family protein [Flavobacteriales bacterium]
MNWLDWTLLILLAFAAFQGFTHGFVREVAALVAWVAGIWAGIHLNDRVAGWIGLDPEQEAVSFLVTFLIVLAAVQLLGRALTAAIDAAQLSLPNKLAGVFFGVLRKAFVLSVLLNIIFAKEAATWTPDKATREGSALYAPIRDFAPMVVPALGETKWVRKAVDRVQEEMKTAAED